MGTSSKNSRWLGLCVGMWMQACGGISYTFSLYSADLKTVMGYNQELIDGLGTSKDIGGNVGIVSGLFIDRTSASFVLLVGGLMHFTFYMMLYLAATKQISPTSWQMCGIIMLVTNGATWFNTAVLVTCMRNFPSDRGVVVGLLKGFIGLSGALFCASFPPVVALLSMLVIRPHEPPKLKDEGDSSRFTMLYVTGVALAFYLLCIILLQDFIVVGKAASKTFMVVMLFILLIPGAVTLRTPRSNQKLSADDHVPSRTPVKTPVSHTKNSITIDVGSRVSELRTEGLNGLPGSPSKHKLRLGSGLTAINNLAQMAESLNSKSIGAGTSSVDSDPATFQSGT